MSELKVNKISPRSGTDVTLGDSGDTFTVPTGVTLDTSNSTVTLPDGSVSLAKLSATGTKDATTFLRGDNTFAVAGGDNTPSFQAIKSGNQSIPDNTFTKLQPDTENWDTDSAYDNSTNYRFTPQTSGKYVLHGFCQNNSTTGITYLQLAIYKNGVVVETSTLDSGDADYDTAQITRVVEANGSTDYFELYLLQYSGGALNFTNLNFTGYKLIGV